MVTVNSIQTNQQVAFSGIKKQATTADNSGLQVAGLPAGMPAVPMAYFTSNVSFKGLDEDGMGTVKGYKIEPQADLRKARLEGANLTGAFLLNARFEGARLEGAILPEANLCKARFEGADLTGADLTNACLCETKLEGAKLEGARFTKDGLEQLPEGSKQYISEEYKIMSTGGINAICILLPKDAEEIKI